MKFNLPKEPIDGYTIVYYSIDYDRLEECRLIYHVRTDWKTLFPEDDRAGAPFTNEWMMWRGKHFSGRIDGWNSFKEEEWGREFNTKDEAIRELKKRLKRSKKSLENQLSEVNNKILALG